MPAQATANSVIASAKRLIDVRHSCRSSSRIAEISVPAWPMPIHQTKLMMSKPQPDREVDAPDADAVEEQLADGSSRTISSENADAERREPPRRGVRCAGRTVADLVGDRRRACARADDRRHPSGFAGGTCSRPAVKRGHVLPSPSVCALGAQRLELRTGLRSLAR